MANLVKVEFLEEHENPFEMVTPAEDISQEGQLLYLLWVEDGDNIAYGRVFVADYNNELLIEDYYQFICTQWLCDKEIKEAFPDLKKRFQKSII